MVYFTQFEGNRSAASCELTWRNLVSNGNAPWTDEDDALLIEVVADHGAHDWDMLADLVGVRAPNVY